MLSKLHRPSDTTIQQTGGTVPVQTVPSQTLQPVMGNQQFSYVTQPPPMYANAQYQPSPYCGLPSGLPSFPMFQPIYLPTCSTATAHCSCGIRNDRNACNCSNVHPHNAPPPYPGHRSRTQSVCAETFHHGACAGHPMPSLNRCESGDVQTACQRVTRHNSLQNIKCIHCDSVSSEESQFDDRETRNTGHSNENVNGEGPTSSENTGERRTSLYNRRVIGVLTTNLPI